MTELTTNMSADSQSCHISAGNDCSVTSFLTLSPATFLLNVYLTNDQPDKTSGMLHCRKILFPFCFTVSMQTAALCCCNTDYCSPLLQNPVAILIHRPNADCRSPFLEAFVSIPFCHLDTSQCSLQLQDRIAACRVQHNSRCHTASAEWQPDSLVTTVLQVIGLSNHRNLSYHRKLPNQTLSIYRTLPTY